jgi:hypothetical protein
MQFVASQTGGSTMPTSQKQRADDAASQRAVKEADRAYRHRVIVRLAHAGVDVATIARRIGVSQDIVRKALSPPAQ